MANRILDTGTDQFMPEFWPANKLIGILENVLIEAKDIIGELTSDQIEGLVTWKLIGKLTDEQIEEIAAAKISGQLTNAQIQELEAAKISGQIVDSQIKELTAGKLKGVLTSAQIESLEATKITGELTGAQIKELATVKLVGQIAHAQIAAEAVWAINIAALSITAEKIAVESVTAEKLQAGSVSTNKLAASSVTAEKIAAEAVEANKIAALAVTTGKLAAEAVTAGKISTGAITTEKILAEAVTATKIAAGSITTVKLAAESITAEKIAAAAITAVKLNVAELSAITSNMGTIKSGRISFEMETAENPNHKLSWDKGNFHAESYAYYYEPINGTFFKQEINNFYGGVKTGHTDITHQASETLSAITVSARVLGEAGGGGTLIDSQARSSFLQLGNAAKIRDWGLVSALPAEPVKGDRCFFIADAVNGIIWTLVYDGNGEWPWKKVGGPPLIKRDAGGARATKSKVFQTTGAPSVTAPLKMVCICRYGCMTAGVVPASITGMLNSIFVSEVQTHTTEVVQSTAFGTVPIHTLINELSLAKAAVVQNRYKNAQENEAIYRELFVEIDPVKVG